jgi:hypothetical protein
MPIATEKQKQKQNFELWEPLQLSNMRKSWLM